MEREKVLVSAEDLERQRTYMRRVRALLESRGVSPTACVDTFGCQQNVADGERLQGMLQEMGFTLTEEPEGADVVLLNTCAVREHAEDRVFGNLGALSHSKKANPDMIIGLCGCNNFCSYCIVPYVRGRERSRDPQCVLEEVRSLVEAGYKDITLLGQNVNSYGNDLGLGYDFADLLSDIDKIPGEYLIRFTSSHPKDATHKLFDTMARWEHVAKQLHLPFQSGNDRVLKEMNRRYDREKYLSPYMTTGKTIALTRQTLSAK